MDNESNQPPPIPPKDLEHRTRKNLQKLKEEAIKRGETFNPERYLAPLLDPPTRTSSRAKPRKPTPKKSPGAASTVSASSSSPDDALFATPAASTPPPITRQVAGEDAAKQLQFADIQDESLDLTVRAIETQDQDRERGDDSPERETGEESVEEADEQETEEAGGSEEAEQHQNSGGSGSGGDGNEGGNDQAPNANAAAEMSNNELGRFQPRYFSNDPSSGESWITYRAHFELIAKLNNWEDKDARRILASHMSGAAAHATLHIPVEATDDSKTLDDLIKNYNEIFLPKASSETARINFDLSKQQPGEPLIQYASKLRCLFLHAYPEQALNMAEGEKNRILIRRFIYGLRDPGVQREVFRKEPESFTAALAAALNETSLVEAQNQMRMGLISGDSAVGGAVSLVGNSNQQKKMVAYDECRICYKKGHWAKDCPNKNFQGGRGRGQFQFRGRGSAGRGKGFRGRGMTGRRPTRHGQIAALGQRMESLIQEYEQLQTEEAGQSQEQNEQQQEDPNQDGNEYDYSYIA